MKKSSKVVSLVLAVVLALSCFTGLSLFSASAADTEKIYFQVPTLEAWGTTSQVFCHIYNVYGDDTLAEIAWGAKAEQCKLDADTGLYYYDCSAEAKKLFEYEEPGNKKSTKIYRGLKDGCDYALLFYTKDSTGAEHQTGNVTFSTECYGGTVYVTGELTENTEDSTKLDYAATWTDPALAAKYGPKAAITSTGKVVGEKFPVNQPKELIVSQFLHTWAVANATLLTPEVVQEDCVTLGVEPMDVYNQYATDYAEELADPENYPTTASLEAIAALLGVDPTPVADDVIYVVAGTENLTGFNYNGNPEEAVNNVMTKNGDVYTKTFENVQPDDYQIKIVANPVDGEQEWIGVGDEYQYNLAFRVVEAPCDVTVTYNPETKEITVSGDTAQLITEIDIEKIVAVGGGSGAFLNDVAWDPDSDDNVMTEVSDKVYQITYTGVEYFGSYQFKFAANGSWNDNWGGAFIDSDTETDAEYNGGNIQFSVPYETADVTLTLDLTNFNYADKKGAKFTVSIVATGDVVPVYGDVNRDGKINVLDATEIQKAGIHLVELDETAAKLADVNNDGKINVIDATYVQKYIAKLGYNTVLVGQEL